MLPRTTSLVILLLAMVFPVGSEAATIVFLPAGESEALWTELVSTAESWAGGGEGSISIQGEAGHWTLLTRDLTGREHRVVIVAPSDDEARMEVAMLAVSLLQPPVMRPSPRRVVRDPAPVTVPVEITTPVVAASPEVDEPPSPSPRGSFPSSLGGFAAVTGALELHEAQVQGGTIAVETGVGFPAGLRLAARVVLDGDFGAPTVATYPLSGLPPIHLAVGGGVSWSANVPISPLVGIAGGVRWNVARSPDRLLRRRVRTPQLDVILGLSINPPGWLRFEPIALLRVGANVDLLEPPSTSNAPLDVSVLAGLKVSLLSPARSPLRIDRRGR